MPVISKHELLEACTFEQGGQLWVFHQVTWMNIPQCEKADLALVIEGCLEHRAKLFGIPLDHIMISEGKLPDSLRRAFGCSIREKFLDQIVGRTQHGAYGKVGKDGRDGIVREIQRQPSQSGDVSNSDDICST